MAEYFVHPVDGDDGGAGTEGDPWKSIPGMTGGNTVLAGDIINIRSGTWVKNGRLVLTANNLTYRCYGLSSEVLMLKLPVYVARVPVLVTQKIVRELGVHEGYVVLDGSDETSQGIINYSTRTGCVVEDIVVKNIDVSSQAINIGTSSQAQVGATLRRCGIIDCASTGIGIFRPNTLIEYCLLQDIDDDAVAISTGATQSFHAGNFTTVRYNNIINPGRDTVAAIGDAVQLNASTGYQGVLTISGNYIYKPSQVKQGIFMGDISGTAYVQGNYFDGAVDGATQIGLTDLLAGSKTYIRGNYWVQACIDNGNPIVRIDGGVTENTSQLYIENNYVDIYEHSGLFTWGAGSSAAAPDGAVIIRHNHVKGRAFNELSWSGNVSLQTLGTIGANASAVIENNLLTGASPTVFRLPTGGLNDTRWVYRNNLVDGATNFASVGVSTAETNYTKDTFEAGHSTATGNKEEVADQDSLQGAGIFLGYRTDMNGKQFYNPPSIGAYEYERPRIARS